MAVNTLQSDLKQMLAMLTGVVAVRLRDTGGAPGSVTTITLRKRVYPAPTPWFGCNAAMTADIGATAVGISDRRTCFSVVVSRKCNRKNFTMKSGPAPRAAVAGRTAYQRQRKMSLVSTGIIGEYCSVWRVCMAADTRSEQRHSSRSQQFMTEGTGRNHSGPLQQGPVTWSTAVELIQNGIVSTPWYWMDAIGMAGQPVKC